MDHPFHGPIRVSSNGRHFVDAPGQPFFWLGDTAWPLFTRYSVEDAEKYLANRAAKGFTVIQGVLALYPDVIFTNGEQPAQVPNRYGQVPWLNNNPATPNPDFFTHVDHLLDVAERLGLVLAILPLWGAYVNKYRWVTTENARAYTRWVAARYRERPNIVWVNGGDHAPTGFEPVWRELGMGLREGDGGAHLITYHPCGWLSSAPFWHDEPWLDFNMIETWSRWDMIYPAILAEALRVPTKPIVMGEPAYENGPEYYTGPITPLVARRQAWWTVLAGGFHTYGQNQMWRMEPGWAETFDTPGAEQVCLMRRILSRRRWWEMNPDPSLFALGESHGRTRNVAALAARADWALVYLSSQCTVLLNLDKLLAPTIKATFIDPRTGEEKEAGIYTNPNYGSRSYGYQVVQSFSVPPYWEDAVLLLEGQRD
jgi:hypothetical protein